MSKNFREHDWKYKIVILTYSYERLSSKYEHFFYEDDLKLIKELALTQLAENRKVFVVDHRGIIYDSRKDSAK